LFLYGLGERGRGAGVVPNREKEGRIVIGIVMGVKRGRK
jgi:hypothetical protein